MAYIPRIAFSGGPSGGKSWIIRYVQQRLPTFGFYGIVCPELATLNYENGIRFPDFAGNKEAVISFQSSIITQQRLLEDQLIDFADVLADLKPNKQFVLLCDRGTVDNLAYADEEDWPIIIRRSHSYDRKSMMGDYDGVIHLQTAAAIGAYDQSNVARYEDAETALKMDRRMLEVWDGMERHVVIEAHENLEWKAEQALIAVIKIYEDYERSLNI